MVVCYKLNIKLKKEIMLHPLVELEPYILARTIHIIIHQSSLNFTILY